MIGRVLLAALLAGIAAGLFMSVIQHVRITPLILEAEKYENAGGHEHSHEAASAQSTTGAESAAVAEQAAEEEGWAPGDGLERTAYTTLASVVAGAGFAALLAGISILLGMRITPANGMLWGICGFLSFHLAPAAGLAPELPGMPAADLVLRQIWWIGTIIATGVAIALFMLRSEPWVKAAAIVLLLIPHVIGAPMPPTHESGVPAGLAAEFAANTLAAAFLFWCAIGGLLGLTLDRFVQER
jgi:cobalt transporter subunit CbtA